MAQLVRCFCGKVYDSEEQSTCPACGTQHGPSFASPSLPPRLPARRWVLSGWSSEGRSVRLEISSEQFSGGVRQIVLGRSADLCDLVVDDISVSRQHAHIRLEGGNFTLMDRNSSNGTAVNGLFNMRPYEAMPFQVGDTLTFGEVKLDFSAV